MTACQYPGCTAELPPRKERGRPDEYCADHKRARKREQDKAYYQRTRINPEKPRNISEGYFQCCVEWHQAGRSNRTTCPQHKQWLVFCKQSRTAASYSSTRLNTEPIGHDRDVVVSLVESGIAFRVSANPDSWKPVDSHDKKQDKALAEWVDSGMPRAAVMRETYALSRVRQLSVSRGTDKQARRTHVDTDTLNTAACDRVLNGLSYEAGHCRDCDQRLSCIANDKTRDAYRLRDYLGRVITTDSLMLSSSKRVD